MNVNELLAELSDRGITLNGADGQLRVTAPRGALNAKVKAALGSHKQELLTLLAYAERGAQDNLKMVSVECGDKRLLSFAQQRLWFLEQLEGELTAYNMSVAWRLSGTLDTEALRLALEEIVRRHEPLRTTFAMENDQPVQVVESMDQFDLPVEDLRWVRREQLESEINNRCCQETDRPFDLTSDLMLRAMLLRLGDEEHVLLVVVHHIAVDGWSFRVFWHELEFLYDAYCCDAEAGLTELPIRYSDYAVWQQTQLEGQRLANLLEYWEKQLDGATALELPTDRPRPPRPSYRGARHEFTLQSELVRQLKSLGQAAGATLQMTLLAAFQVLLMRCSGQDDIAVAVPIAGRSRAELEPLIGFFVNTLVMRTDLSGHPTFRELLARVRQVSLEAYDHQDLPFERLVEAIQPERHPSRNPLAQVMFQLLNFPTNELALRDLEVARLPQASQRVRFDLEMDLWQHSEILEGAVAYCTDLFDAPTIERMVGQFRTLLEGIVADPDQSISSLPILTRSERHQLLTQWNDTSVDHLDQAYVHEVFEQQARLTPGAVAVVSEGQWLTYRQLNVRANQLAHLLQERGVGTETLVGLCLGRSPELVVGILGILKAGAAYVPVDEHYPPARLKFILDDAKLQYLVTQRRLLDRLPASSCQTVCLDGDAAKLQTHDQTNPLARVHADNVAYVLYTSGSTGLPKGVMVPHGALRNHMHWMCDTFAFSESDKVLQKTSMMFDASVWEFFAPLMNGGSLIIASPDSQRDPKHLIRTIIGQQATVLQVVPTLLRELTREPEFANCDCLRFVFSGGERLTLADQQAVSAQLPHVEFCNLYGPTEACIDATFWHCPHEDQLAPPPIGRPIANTQVLVLDQYRDLVPIGVAGELYIGGTGLARGYLNRPELSAEKFTAHPFSDDRQARLYHTGDRVRWRADGNLEFLGRLDNQVKLRGYRIEPGEIEAVIAVHPSVRQCVVTLREDHPGNQRLVAYCVPADNTTIEFTKLARHLRSRLPDYMVPSAFLALDALPLTPSGKVDRLGLPAPDDSRPELETTYLAPRSATEHELAAIWSKVLDVPLIGIDDNFFALGGHSLLAVSVAARTSTAFQVDLPLRKLFECPTIAELAVEIDALRNREPMSQAAKLSRIDRAQMDGLPLSFAQQRLWFLEQMEGELAAYNMPFAWRLVGTLDAESLRRAIETIVQRHEPLRTTFSMFEGQPIQEIGRSERFELPVDDLRSLERHQQEEAVVKQCRHEAERPFDLTRELMLRAQLLRLGKQEHVLLLTLHHIASDGWSTRVFCQELESLYDAFCTGRDTGLEELPIQYVDYAVWQRQAITGDRLAGLLEYWEQQLNGVCALELPTDFPRPSQPSYRGAHHDFMLGRELAERLQLLSRTEGGTLQITLLAAFQALLARYSCQENVAVGTPVAARSHTELEPLIGFFVNTLVMRTDLSGDPTFRELLRRVRQVSLGAYDHQDLPFERLVEALEPERDPSRNPLAQVLFQLLNFSDKGLSLRELEITRLPQPSRRVRFDLEMHLWQRQEGIQGAAVYSTDLFDLRTIERMVGQFQALLEGIVADPDQNISQLPILTEPERRQLLTACNGTAVPYPHDTCIQKLFERQVERTPDAVAVVSERQKLSYAELNARANQLARLLREQGVRTETLVGLCLERSLELVVGILGILKAGGAYVPLDIGYPAARLEFMLTDAKLRYIVTQHHLAAQLPAADYQVVCLDTDAEKLAAYDVSNPQTDVSGDNLAYILYTSGSTGVPKGVAMEHAPLVNLIRWHQRHPRLCQAARTLQFASCNFDVSFQEMLTTWCVGGTLVLVSEASRRDPNAIWRVIVQSGVQRLFMPFVALQQLAATFRGAATELRDIISAGEALQLTPEIRRLIESHENCRLHNHYGPTESHVVTNHELTGQPKTWPSFAPIGRPLANTEVYVLDQYRQLVPIGVAGELYIGGAALARGYLNHPELTAELFVAHPFSEDPDARLYRTGDRVRRRSDGDLEFLGRLDGQVKLRGYRIELGEIEAVLALHPSVHQCVVKLQESQGDPVGERRLVGYGVAAPGEDLNTAALANHLRSRLPDYMVPSVFVPLDTLPLTPSGKIDRRALATPDDARPELETSYVEPRNDTERQMADIWKQLLQLKRIGIDDDFFRLGGHSLMAVQLFARIETVFGRKLPLAVLFQHGTIRNLAKLLAESTLRTDLAVVVPLQSAGEGRRLFILPSIGGELLFSRPLVEEIGKTRAIFGLQPALHAKNVDEFRDLKVTAANIVAALRAFQPHGPYALAGYSFGGILAYEVACQLDELGERVNLLAILDTGPGGRGRQPGDRRRWMAGAMANLPSWLREEMRDFSASRLWGSAERKFAYASRRLAQRLRNGQQQPLPKKELDDVFGLANVPSQNRELMRTVFAAFRDYVPEPYAGKLTLFRASTRPLFGSFTADLGWYHYVQELEIRPIVGNHESILHPPNVFALANQLAELLENLAT